MERKVHPHLRFFRIRTLLSNLPRNDPPQDDHSAPPRSMQHLTSTHEQRLADDRTTTDATTTTDPQFFFHRAENKKSPPCLLGPQCTPLTPALVRAIAMSTLTHEDPDPAYLFRFASPPKKCKNSAAHYSTAVFANTKTGETVRVYTVFSPERGGVNKFATLERGRQYNIRGGEKTPSKEKPVPSQARYQIFVHDKTTFEHVPKRVRLRDVGRGDIDEHTKVDILACVIEVQPVAKFITRSSSASANPVERTKRVVSLLDASGRLELALMDGLAATLDESTSLPAVVNVTGAQVSFFREVYSLTCWETAASIGSSVVHVPSTDPKAAALLSEVHHLLPPDQRARTHEPSAPEEEEEDAQAEHGDEDDDDQGQAVEPPRKRPCVAG